MAPLKTSLAASLLVAAAAGRDIPSNVQSFYNSVKAQSQCNNVLASGFYSLYDGGPNWDYCGDHRSDYNVIYHQGKNGQLLNMDIDCDGIQKGPADDGRCGSSGDTQSITSFQGTVQGYNTGQRDLDAFIHPYVVFGNTGTKSGYKNFHPQDYGIKPLSVMAVVCNNKLIYGIWGDENGDDGDHPMVGEASISLATACFGTGINGNSGHDETDVLYIAFPGDDAVPGASGAKWHAGSYNEFSASIQGLGDKLIQRIGSSGGNPPSNPPGNPPSGGDCSWVGHCEGASCGSDDDCSDSLTCNNGSCGTAGSTPPPSNDCAWVDHCEGAQCSSYDDCSDELVCTSGKCAYP